MVETITSSYFYLKGRHIETPFRAKLIVSYAADKQIHGTCELICHKILRLLPRKRVVGLCELDGRQVVAKFFLGKYSATRHMKREESGIRALIKAGIKTPDIVLTGKLDPEGLPVLGLAYIPTEVDSNALRVPPLDTEDHAKYLQKIVTVIAKQHNAGLIQKDIHLGNFLITPDDVYTIDGSDLETVRQNTPLPIEKSLRNIALFFAQFPPFFDHLFKAAFYQYAQERQISAPYTLFSKLQFYILEQRKVRKHNYLKKIYRECSAFVSRKTWDHFMVCNREYYAKDMYRFLAAPNMVMEEGKWLKKGNSSSVTLIQTNGHALVVKRYNIKNIFHFFKRTFRPSRAWVSWGNAHRLLFWGIPTPKPVAFMEKRWGPLRLSAYFITEYVRGPDLYHFSHDLQSKNQLLTQLNINVQTLFESLKNAAISHGDLKATNFIVADDGIYVTDLDAMREYTSEIRFQKALMRDQKRFLKNWKKAPEIEAAFKKKVVETSDEQQI